RFRKGKAGSSRLFVPPPQSQNAKTRLAQAICPATLTAHQCRRSEVPDSLVAKSGSGTSDRKRHWNHGFASAHDFPKFVNGSAAMEHELRKVGTCQGFEHFLKPARPTTGPHVHAVSSFVLSAFALHSPGAGRVRPRF